MYSVNWKVLWIFLLYVCLLLRNGFAVPGVNRRNADPRSSLPEDIPMISLTLNSSITTCGQAFIMPSARMVHLSDHEMRQLMENKGGNYLHDYMAATQEEADENFPNMLLITDPSQEFYSTVSMAVSDNYVAKHVLMEDLNKLKFYFLNTTDVNGKPNMAMYTVDNTDIQNGTETDNSDIPTNTQNPSGNITKPTKQTTKPAGNSINPAGDNTNLVSNASNFGAIGNDLTTGHPLVEHVKNGSHTNNSTTTIAPITSHWNYKTNTSRTGSSKAENQKTSTKPITTPAEFNRPGTSSTPSTPSNSESGVMSTISSTSTSAGSDNKNKTEDPLLSLKATTLDPDVQNSLAELNKYLNGLDGLGTSNFGSALSEVKTTLSPHQLVRLVRNASRKKRNTDSSTTTENYCHLKGSLTDDKQYVHICSSCAATTKLSEDFFPRYINEVVCKSGDTDCFKIGNTVHGRCRQQYFTLNVLRKSPTHCMVMNHNGERLVLDDWQLVQKKIRVSCECTINKISFLKPYIVDDSVPVG